MQQLQQTRRRSIFREACQTSGIILGCRAKSGAHGSAAIAADTNTKTGLWLTSELFCCETCFKRRKCFVHREDRGDDGLQFGRRCSRDQAADGAGGAIFGGVRFFWGPVFGCVVRTKKK